MIEGNLSFPVGTGAFEDETGGVPQAANYFGQAGWWSVPNSWATKYVNGVCYVSPNANFSTPVYVAKVNVDYTLVFQNLYANAMQIAVGSGVPAVSTPQVNVGVENVEIIDTGSP